MLKQLLNSPESHWQGPGMHFWWFCYSLNIHQKSSIFHGFSRKISNLRWFHLFSSISRSLFFAFPVKTETIYILTTMVDAPNPANQVSFFCACCCRIWFFLTSRSLGKSCLHHPKSLPRNLAGQKKLPPNPLMKRKKRKNSWHSRNCVKLP